MCLRTSYNVNLLLDVDSLIEITRQVYEAVDAEDRIV